MARDSRLVEAELHQQLVDTVTKLHGDPSNTETQNGMSVVADKLQQFEA